MDKKDSLIAAIKQAMDKNCIKQSDIEKETKIHRSHISGILAGDRSVSLERLIGIAHIVGVDGKFIRRLICW
jgi:transcriptional regulator with XRE-family HTH domain